MTLRTITVPDPAPGVDWADRVPGKYLYDVTGVTATLTVDGTVVAADASGNGNTGAYTFDNPGDNERMLGQPGAIPGDFAARLSDLEGVTGYGLVSQPVPSTMDFSGDFTIEWWGQVDTVAAETGVMSWTDGSVNPHSVTFAADGRMFLALTPTQTYTAPAGSYALDGAWHHYVWSYTAANRLTVTLYRDGFAIGPLVRPASNPVLAATAVSQFWGGSPTGKPGGLDEVALYPSALSGAQVLAHFISSTDFANYTAAVLADAPAVYHHLDETGGPGGRQPALEITDGARVVELIPTGFPAPASGTVFSYSWQPRLQNRAQSADLTLTTVPTPALILPAGYTLGTRTLNLGAADQWSNILIWWDDALQTATAAAQSYQYAPGAHLVYQQVTGSP